MSDHTDENEILKLPTQEELAERVRRVRESLPEIPLDEVELNLGKTVVDIPEVPDLDEIHQKLSGIENQARSSRARLQDQLGTNPRKLAASQSDSRGLARGLAIGYTLIGCPMVGAGVGWLIDRQTNSTIWIGLLTLGGAILGLWVAISRMTPDNPNNP